MFLSLDAVSVIPRVCVCQGETEEEEENLPIQEVTFDPEKAQCCVVECGQGLTHGSGGKGYGLAATGISSGCYQWKVIRTHEIHTLVGIKYQLN